MMELGLQRDGGRDDNGASHCPERENHESSQARGNQSFPDDSADRTTNENGLIGQRCNIELRWNPGLEFGQ